MKIYFYEFALHDIDDIRIYFDKIELGIFTNFLFELESNLKIICSLPEVGSQKFSHLFEGGEGRSIVMKKFQYFIFYELSKKGINILRVLHTRRDVSSILK